MTARLHTRFLLLAVAVAVAGALFGAGYAVASYRHTQTLDAYQQEQRQQEKIEDEMQEDLLEFRRVSAAHMEAERAVAALSDDLSRAQTGLKEEYIVRREKELASEKEKALREAMRYVEVP